jgi:hypothetical protein
MQPVSETHGMKKPADDKLGLGVCSPAELPGYGVGGSVVRAPSGLSVTRRMAPSSGHQSCEVRITSNLTEAILQRWVRFDDARESATDATTSGSVAQRK